MTHFARSSLIIAVFFGIDKIIGFVRALIVNRQFGLSYDLDIFNVANNIPDLLSALISGGALGVALIPVLSEYLDKHGRPAAWNLFSRILNLAFIVTGLIAVLIAVFAEPLVANIIAPGFLSSQKALTVELMRIDLFAILIFSISGLVMAGLQANQHFLLPALAPGLYNIGQIFGAAVLAPDAGFQLGPITLPGMGLGIHGLVYGVIIGALLHLGIQIPGLFKYEFKWHPRIDLKNPGVIQILRLLGPRVATMFFIQMFFIVRDNLASGMGEGAVTALGVGWFIMQVPETLLGTAVAIAILPTISEIFARGEKDHFRDTINGTIRALLAFTLPAAGILAAGVFPLVMAAFGYTTGEAELVSLATRIYLLGLTSHALLEIAARSFYAQQDAKTPLYAAAFNAAAYLGLAVWLSGAYGFAGIALANTLAFTTETLLLLYLLNRRFPGLLRVGATLGRALGAAALSGGLVYWVLGWDAVTGMSVMRQGLVSAGLMLAGVALALPLIWPEVKLIMSLGQNQEEVLG